MSKKRKDEAHAEWVAREAKDVAHATSEAAFGSAGSGSSLPVAAATGQDRRGHAITEKRPNPNMTLMIMGMANGIEPSLVQVLTMSGEF